MDLKSLMDAYFHNELTDVSNRYIVNEMDLIAQKKSKLSKSKRDKVEKEFNKRFKSK